MCDWPAALGETALTYSAAAGNDVGLELIIRSFRRLGLDVDHVNKSGRTALLIAVSRGHVECAAILAADGRANTRLRDPVTGLTADQLALTCTGCPLKRPSPPDITSSGGGATSGRRGGGTRTALQAGGGAGWREDGGAGEAGAPGGGGRKTYDAASESSFGFRLLSTGNGRALRRNSLPSIKVRFDDLGQYGGRTTSTPTATDNSTVDDRGWSLEQNTTTTTVDDELSG